MPNMVFTGHGLVSLESVTFTDPPSFLAEDWWLDLFTNTETVAYNSVIADFDLATFGGYSRVSIERANFHLAVQYPPDQALVVYTPSPPFSCTGGTPQTVYGWVMVGKVTGEVYVGQNFASGRVMSSGASLLLDPFQIRMRSIPPGL